MRCATRVPCWVPSSANRGFGLATGTFDYCGKWSMPHTEGCSRVSREAFPRLASYGVTSGTPIAIAFAETRCRKLINDEPLNEESQAAMD